MLLDDVRRTLEGLAGTLTPARAQQLAKDMMEPGAAKEQVAKATADLLEWSQSNRERIKDFVSREVQHQTKTVGLASQAELDALKKRVRELERGAGQAAALYFLLLMDRSVLNISSQSSWIIPAFHSGRILPFLSVQ